MVVVITVAAMVVEILSLILLTNKSSGAEGWEDRSYGNSSENAEYESGRSRRKRGVSNESNASNEES